MESPKHATPHPVVRRRYWHGHTSLSEDAVVAGVVDSLRDQNLPGLSHTDLSGRPGPHTGCAAGRALTIASHAGRETVTVVVSDVWDQVSVDTGPDEVSARRWARWFPRLLA
jgi:hypothetical protein